MLLTFDCYGTLIDWETGILAAIRASYPASASLPDRELLESFHESQNTLKGGRYRPYRRLLAEAADELALARGWAISEPAAEAVGASVPTWKPFADTNEALTRLRDAGATLGILSNVDDDLLAGTLEHFAVPFGRLGTAERLRSYKPAAPHFELGRRWSEEEDDGRWLHIAQSLYHDIVPATRLGIPSVWVNRLGEKRPSGASPLYEAPDLAAAAEWVLSAG
ncbi:MAG: haloacid dehalogenase [Gemmatimonadota bacterium]|nr:haloacid dehalogenase [Gemmatimonadota bacterium]